MEEEEGEEEGEEEKKDKEKEKVEEERPFLSFSAYIFKAISLWRACTSSTSPFRTSFSCFSFLSIKGFPPTRILRV